MFQEFPDSQHGIFYIDQSCASHRYLFITLSVALSAFAISFNKERDLSTISDEHLLVVPDYLLQRTSTIENALPSGHGTSTGSDGNANGLMKSKSPPFTNKRDDRFEERHFDLEEW
ncbi:hypothetical protein H0H92_010153 [Tricholoma furcatifolium]|nr:hypothetical protein H0H92_010153 [Tricholoma furcatifolium]